jgi:2-keto-3-deoxy-L-rhamnonate aldolase RhmA
VSPHPGDGFGDSFRLTLITDDPVLAAAADQAGVDRVGLDLETIGKAARQAGLDVRMSNHSVTDVGAVARALRRARTFVRINPIHPGSAEEVEAVIEAGAQDVMLPYFHTPEEAETFVRLLDGRARPIVLIETAAALVRAREILEVDGLEEAMLGLNDMRLALGVDSHFQVLASPVAAMVAAEAARAGLAFTVGGVTRHDQPGLPAPPDLVLAQYPRLAATGAWLSRSFMARANGPAGLAEDVAAIRARLNQWGEAGPEALEDAQAQLMQAARSS